MFRILCLLFGIMVIFTSCENSPAVSDLTTPNSQRPMMSAELKKPQDNSPVPGAPAACSVDGNNGTFNRDRLIASYNKFYGEYSEVITGSQQQYMVIMATPKGNNDLRTLRVLRLTDNLKTKRAGAKFARGFLTCQEAIDFRSLVLDDYNGVNQVRGTQAVGTQAVNEYEWTLHLFRLEQRDNPSTLPHLRKQFRMDIQVVRPGGTPSPKAGYTPYDLTGYDETTTYGSEQQARMERKRLLLDYTRGSDTKQGGVVLYLFQIAEKGFPFDEWEIKNENGRPWIQGGRWVDADVGGTQITPDGVFIFEGRKHECGIKTVNIDVGRTVEEIGLTYDDPDGVLSSRNPNEVDVNGNGILDSRDRDRNGNGRLDQDDIIFGQYRDALGNKIADFGDKRDVRVIGVFDADDDGIIEVSDLDRNGNGVVDAVEVFDYFHGRDVFVLRDADTYCDKVIHFEYFPRRKEGISGEIWARHRLFTWLEFGE